MPNQYLGTPPLELLEEHARKYHQQGNAQKRVLELLKRHYDTNVYSLGLSTLKKYYGKWGLQGTRKQGHTVDTIHGPIQELRAKYPQAGANELRHLLRMQKDMKVPRDLISDYLRMTEPDKVRERKSKRFVRRHFYAAGVNHIWSVDQHDKWQRFGLKMHICVEVCSGTVIWLKAWWTNSNPRLVAKQYLDAVRKHGAPLLTQSDLGSENYGIANAHTSIRQFLDPTLIGTLQHRWMRGHSNIKAEIAWKQMRFRWARGFEQLFDEELYKAYDPVNILQKLLFRWLAIPFIQRELDGYVFHHNNTSRRADRHKVLPHGIPQDIFEHSRDYGVTDYKIPIPEAVITEAEQQFCPADHAVFQLVPQPIDQFLAYIYAETLKKPVVDFSNFWQIYKAMLAIAQAVHTHVPEVMAIIDAYGNVQQGGENDDIPLMAHNHEGGLGLFGVPNAVVVEEDIDQVNNSLSDPDLEPDAEYRDSLEVQHTVAVEVEEREEMLEDSDAVDNPYRTVQVDPEAEYEAYISD